MSNETTQLYDIVQTDFTNSLIRILTTKPQTYAKCEEFVANSKAKRLIIVSELDLNQSDGFRSPWDAPATIH